jgi:hypothetical protein
VHVNIACPAFRAIYIFSPHSLSSERPDNSSDFQMCKDLAIKNSNLAKKMPKSFVWVITGFLRAKKVSARRCLSQIMYTGNGHLKPKLSTSGVQIHRWVDIGLISIVTLAVQVGLGNL